MLSEENVFCQPSWVLRSSTVRAAVTRLGAQMAPVYFDCGSGNIVQPYHVSPWQSENNAVPEGNSNKILRGDFFCLPFGYVEPETGTPSHGKTAGMRWSFQSFCSKAGVHELRIHMPNALHSAEVTRQFFLRDGHNVVYDRTTITGLSGMHTLGHHAVLRMPGRHSSLLVSTSKQLLGMTNPRHFAATENPDRQSLASGATFSDLATVPSLKDSSTIDCSTYPARPGFSDLLQIAIQAEEGMPAWTAAVNTEEGYLWFSIRDASLLPSTLFWIENEGRTYYPWNGRNRSLGLEDVCSYFDTGSKRSSESNPFSERGIRTVRCFQSDRPVSVHYIQGVARTPTAFGRVQSVHFEAQEALFTDSNGVEVRVDISPGFVFGGVL